LCLQPVRFKASGLSKADLSKKYGPWFMWGQLNTWFKQTVYDPSATLSAGRRGTISLPDIESCYANAKARYTAKASPLSLLPAQGDCAICKVSGLTSANLAIAHHMCIWDCDLKFSI
jgi:hypothetical protein